VTAESRTLGLDYGSRRIGIALSDPLGIIAQGLCTIDNDEDAFDAVEDIIRDQHVGRVVVGIPYAPDGGLGRKGEEVMEFVERLRAHVDVPVETWDESFSTAEAHRRMREAGMKKARRREKGRADEMAARIILQEYLENTLTGPPPP
jgi:putative Holliday junction resolvase